MWWPLTNHIVTSLNFCQSWVYFVFAPCSLVSGIFGHFPAKGFKITPIFMSVEKLRRYLLSYNKKCLVDTSVSHMCLLNLQRIYTQHNSFISGRVFYFHSNGFSFYRYWLCKDLYEITSSEASYENVFDLLQGLVASRLLMCWFLLLLLSCY